MEISLTSLGSSQTLPFPHLSTLADRRFWSLSDTILSPRLSLSVSLGRLFSKGLASAAGKAIYSMRIEGLGLCGCYLTADSHGLCLG